MSAKRKSSLAVPENINEEYYQISTEILSSFPRYRPPVDLFFFREDIAVLAPFSRKGARLSNEQVEEVNQLCENGNLFVSRSDHHIYFEHMIKQLDLVLQDHNLKESEIVSICIDALKMRYDAFYSQPVKSVFENLQRDVLVLTEYLMEDPTRINAFMRRLNTEYNPVNHAMNTMIVGLWLRLKRPEELTRKDLDSLAIGLLIHDIGMSKMPQFFLTRKGPLKNEERDKIVTHPIQSVKILQKMEVGDNNSLYPCFEHHERLDGSGYPQRTKGKDIHLAGRICAIADSFSAMISDRPYASKMEPLKAANELSEHPGYDASLARQLVGAYATGKF